VKVTQPISQVLLDDVTLPGVTSSQISQVDTVVDLVPILREGTYTCEGNTLTLRPAASKSAVSWVFQRA
jgi:hypothetical protein